jgi:hypothetical protein
MNQIPDETHMEPNLLESIKEIDSERHDDYDPYSKNEYKEKNTILKTISNYFTFTEEDKLYFTKLNNDEKENR